MSRAPVFQCTTTGRINPWKRVGFFTYSSVLGVLDGGVLERRVMRLLDARVPWGEAVAGGECGVVCGGDGVGVCCGCGGGSGTYAWASSKENGI
jgi:hypothetical protein